MESANDGEGCWGRGVAALGGTLPHVHAGEAKAKGGGNIKQSVCRWCYEDIPLEKLAVEAKRIGYQSIELLTPAEFPDA